MAMFEVHRLAENRWLLQAVFEDAAAAIEDAKTTVARAQTPVTVRVLAVQPRHHRFAEWLIFRESTADQSVAEAVADAAEEHSEPLPVLQRAEAPRPPLPPSPRRLPPAARRMPSPPPLGRPHLIVLIAVLTLGSALGLLAHYGPSSHSVWLFDRPEAMEGHPIRNPLSGEISHGAQP